MSECISQVKVDIAGATGLVGQRFIERLHNHPFFTVSHLAASDRNIGKTYEEAVHWVLDSELPEDIANIQLISLSDLTQSDSRMIFSALPSESAGALETELAIAGKAVFTNASAHRMDKDVPLIIPEVNPDHLSLIHEQPTSGYIVANANCGSIIGTLALAPLHRQFGLKLINIFTQQALSGAGYPGVPSLDMIDNIIPFIEDEEDKLATEPLKMLGTTHTPAAVTIIPTATRVSVRDGHMITVHVTFQENDVKLDNIHEVWQDYHVPNSVSELPSAPTKPIHIFSQPDRPQPRRDRDIDGGMAVSVGRIRQIDKMGEMVVQCVILGHNTIRGAAGQSVFNAELAYSRDLFK